MHTQKPDSDSNRSQRDTSGSRRSDSKHRGHGARKERVLHTRISEQLAEDIRNFAEDLRVPASNLVRNVLEEVFSVVDRVSGDVGHLMDDVIDEAEGVRDRVRGQTSSRARGRAERSRRRSSRRRETSEAGVEEEFRRDEAAEADSSDRTRKSQTNERDRGASGSEDEPDGSPHEQSPPESPLAADLFPDILGWQPLVLNRDFACGRCDRALAAGESAFLGIGTTGLTETALCGRCASSRAA
jgi:hypothetical protein